MSIKARWIVSIGVVLLAIMLAFSQAHWGDVQWNDLAMETEEVALIVLIVAQSFVFITMFYAWLRQPTLTFIMGVTTLLYLVCACLKHFHGTQFSGEWTEYLLYYGMIVLAPYNLLVLFVLASVRFRKKLEGLRVAAIAVGVLRTGFSLASVHFHDVLFKELRAAITVCTVVLFLMCAWCIAFYRREKHDSLEKAVRLLSMFCPRCDAALRVDTSRDCQCPDCKLRITLSLEDCVCRNCRYPLRGLMGDRCPECGARIVPPVDALESDAGTAERAVDPRRLAR